MVASFTVASSFSQFSSADVTMENILRSGGVLPRFFFFFLGGGEMGVWESFTVTDCAFMTDGPRFLLVQVTSPLVT